MEAAMKVSFYATLRQIVGGKEVMLPDNRGYTVQQLLDALLVRFPALRRELLDEQGRLYAHVHIFVNSRDASFLENGMDTLLDPGDTIGIFPAVGGG